EYVATSAMIVTRDRAEGFALRAFAAARRAKKEKGLVSHHDEIAYTARPVRYTSIVIPSPSTPLRAGFVEGFRGISLKLINGVFRPRKLSGLKMTKTPRRDLRLPVAHRDRSARSRRPEQRSCNPDQARRFSPARILSLADAQ